MKISGLVTWAVINDPMAGSDRSTGRLRWELRPWVIGLAGQLGPISTTTTAVVCLTNGVAAFIFGCYHLWKCFGGKKWNIWTISMKIVKSLSSFICIFEICRNKMNEKFLYFACNLMKMSKWLCCHLDVRFSSDPAACLSHLVTWWLLFVFHHLNKNLTFGFNFDSNV